jgi:hypothetical protein
MKPQPPTGTRRSSAVARLALSILVGAAPLFVALHAVEARPGGGHGFSGGGHSGGGQGGGGGDGGRLGVLIVACIDYPQVSIPLLLIVLIGWVATRWLEGHQLRWSSAADRNASFVPSGVDAGSSFAGPRPAAMADLLRAADPLFSFVLFEDFLNALYAEAHTARGNGKLELLAPYLSQPARGALARYPATEVKAIVVGSMRLLSATTAGRVEVEVAFETNYTERDATGAEHSYWAAERWRLARALTAKSRPPEASSLIGCPNCGAPLEAVRGRVCSYCQKVVDTGEFDWLVTDLEIEGRAARGPMLNGTTEEKGTGEPTIVAPDANARYYALCAKDPAHSWPRLMARVALVFNQFQVAWSSQDLAPVRPYLSDSLFQAQLYWIDAYRAAHLRNVTEGAHIITVHLARVITDRFYDAITLRVFASGLDYTLDEDGHVVGGSREKEREYSEYWTFIRGSDRRGPPRTDPSCPNCGAALDINMAGHCKYCCAKVTAGAFDWVLSRIEQDEVYQG